MTSIDEAVLRADIKNGKIHVVVVIDESQIALNYLIVSDLIDKIKKLGIRLMLSTVQIMMFTKILRQFSE